MKFTLRTLGAIGFISGTSIGAGMLALPVTTAKYGFAVSSAVFVGCWFVMTIAALLMLEVNLWLKPDTNLISMAKNTLGRFGQIVAWGTYLLLLYALLAAYLSGMNALASATAEVFFHLHLANWVGACGLIVVLGIFIYLGPLVTDYLNRLLIIGLIATFVILLGFVAPHIQLSQLAGRMSNDWWWALPVIITSFGFQIIIPSLRSYLNSDVKQLRVAIIIGGIIPLVVYVIWEFAIMGVIPVGGENGLLAIFASGQPATGLTESLQDLLENPLLSTLSRLFGFFAIATSFIGVSLSLFDFVADGFQLDKSVRGKLITTLITFIPPLIFALLYPRGFILALGFAGIFVAILLIIYPALMTWIGRGRFESKYKVRGGKPVFVVLFAVGLAIILVQVLSHL